MTPREHQRLSDELTRLETSFSLDQELPLGVEEKMRQLQWMLGAYEVNEYEDEEEEQWQ